MRPSGKGDKSLDDVDGRKSQMRRLEKILDGITDFPWERISDENEEQIADVVHVAKEFREKMTDVPVEEQCRCARAYREEDL